MSLQSNFRAQPDWVEAAGEHPPLITSDKIPRAGVMPEINIPAKPLILKKDNHAAITAGSGSSNEKLVNGNEQVKLKDTTKDDTK